jgi:hypothetical protein
MSDRPFGGRPCILYNIIGNVKTDLATRCLQRLNNFQRKFINYQKRSKYVLKESPVTVSNINATSIDLHKCAPGARVEQELEHLRIIRVVL